MWLILKDEVFLMQWGWSCKTFIESETPIVLFWSGKARLGNVRWLWRKTTWLVSSIPTTNPCVAIFFSFLNDMKHKWFMQLIINSFATDRAIKSWNGLELPWGKGCAGQSAEILPRLSPNISKISQPVVPPELLPWPRGSRVSMRAVISSPLRLDQKELTIADWNPQNLTSFDAIRLLKCGCWVAQNSR